MRILQFISPFIWLRGGGNVMHHVVTATYTLNEYTGIFTMKEPTSLTSVTVTLASLFPFSEVPLCLMNTLALAALNHIICLIIRTMSFNSSQNTWLPLDTIETRCLTFQINFTKNHRKKTGEDNMQTFLIACQGDDRIFFITAL